MNKPDFATQWEVLASRIAHIERLAVAGLAVFGAVVGFVFNKGISSTDDFWLFSVILAALTFAYLHLMFILALHGRHIVALERESDGEFSVFLKIFDQINLVFYLGWASCAMLPAFATAGVAFAARQHAPFPIAAFVIGLLSVALVMTLAGVWMLFGLRTEMAKAKAKKRTA
jgi:hypothetical protein